MKTFLQKHFHHLVWVIIPLLLWWAFRSIPLKDVLGAIRQLSLSNLLLIILINVLVILSYVARWWFILKSQGYNLSFYQLLRYKLGALGLSYFSPGPQIGGEPFQIFMLIKKDTIPGASAIASIAIDKLFEAGVKFAFITFGVCIILQLGVFGKELSYFLLFIPAMVLLFIFSLYFSFRNNKKPISFLIKKMPLRIKNYATFQKLSSILEKSENEIGAFSRNKPLTVLSVLIFSVVSWLLIVAEIQMSLYFLGISLNIWQVIAALAAARLAFSLPVPAGLGTLEAGLVLVLSALGVEASAGLALSLIIRGRDVLFGVAGLIMVYYLIGRYSIFKINFEQEVTS